MNKTKFASLLLAATMSISALSACGEKTPANTTATEAVTTVEISEEFTPANAKYNDEFVLLVSGKDPNSNVDFKDFSNIDAS